MTQTHRTRSSSPRHSFAALRIGNQTFTASGATLAEAVALAALQHSRERLAAYLTGREPVTEAEVSSATETAALLRQVAEQEQAA